MKKVVLISCVKKKLDHEAKAEDLYISPYFIKNLQYAKSINPDNIFILSAKYGLLKLDDKIVPYDKTLNKMKTNEIRKWAESVLNQLKSVSDLDNDEFIFLTGDKYRKFLILHIKHYKIPMLGLGIGKQLQWLKENINNE